VATALGAIAIGAVGLVFAADGDDPARLTPAVDAATERLSVSGLSLAVAPALEDEKATCFVVSGFPDGSRASQCEPSESPVDTFQITFTDRGSGTALATGYQPGATGVTFGGRSASVDASGLWAVTAAADSTLVVRRGDEVVLKADPSDLPPMPATR
jgi:hypothetical protein